MLVLEGWVLGVGCSVCKGRRWIGTGCPGAMSLDLLVSFFSPTGLSPSESTSPYQSLLGTILKENWHPFLELFFFNDLVEEEVLSVHMTFG